MQHRLVLLGLALVGCGSSQGVDPNPPPPTPVHLDPTLDSLQTKLFTVTCANRNCHSVGTHKAGLVLETAELACQNLIGVASTRVPARIRLVPGQPDDSYILNKLENRLDPFDRLGDDAGVRGSPMPWSFSGTSLLPADERQAVRDWVSAGAPGCTQPDGGPDGGPDAATGDGG